MRPHSLSGEIIEAIITEACDACTACKCSVVATCWHQIDRESWNKKV